MSRDISVDQVSMVFYGRGEPVIALISAVAFTGQAKVVSDEDVRAWAAIVLGELRG